MIDSKSKQFIQKIISEKTNKKFQIKKLQAIYGGDINQSYKIEDDHQQFFIKINNASKLINFQSELVDLKEIISTKTILAPNPIAVDMIYDISFIVLEYVEIGECINLENLAKNLASMHNNKNQKFGYKTNNYIGKTKQINNFEKGWVEFYFKNRIGFQIDLLDIKYNVDLIRKKAKKIYSLSSDLFLDYAPEASLLHGDLWHGNYAFNQQGEAVIYDPACYYGDDGIIFQP